MSKETRMIELMDKERALLVTVDVYAWRRESFKSKDEAGELRELAKTSGVDIAAEISCQCEKPMATLFIGKGKAREIGLLAGQEGASTVIFSCDLSGTQQRNLEEELGCKVIDRTQLILDIFAQHARSPEGKMQVELAQLEYLVSRLVGKGIMLSRLGGGIGTRGPGEQKLEIDRRRIQTRISKLKSELKRLRSHRSILRKKRKEEAVPSVVLVGYTNAGKTTLFNSLVGENQPADNSLFTTLDTLSRTLPLPNRQKAVISDTVGFLHNLPHNLIEAFKATMEDVKEADLLVHVLDISHALRYSYYDSVMVVLKELECQDKQVITVLNKVDKLDDSGWLERYKADFTNSIAISALKKENLGELIQSITDRVSAGIREVEIVLPINKMGLVDLIYREGQVEDIKYSAKSVEIRARLRNTTICKISSCSKIKYFN